MTQLDLIPAKPFSEIAESNLRRYAVSVYGQRNRVLRANKDAVTAILRAEVDQAKTRVRSYRRVKSKSSESSIPLLVQA